MTSDTPRTDAAWKAAFRGTYIDAESLRDFAQSLELEGNAASAEIEAMQVAIREAHGVLGKAAKDTKIICGDDDGGFGSQDVEVPTDLATSAKAALAKLQPFIPPGA